MLVLFSFINFSWHQLYHLKPRGHIGSLTEIRENYQNPNPYPPSRPPIYKLADTLEKVHSRKLHGSVLRVNVVFNWSKIFVAFIIILIIAITSWKLRYVGNKIIESQPYLQKNPRHCHILSWLSHPIVLLVSVFLHATRKQDH